MSLGQIAASTKIRVYYLRAIENGEIEKLPEGVYARSYVRQYARAIDYDEYDLLERCGLLCAVQDPVPEPRQPSGGLRRLVHFLTLRFHPHGTASGAKRTG